MIITLCCNHLTVDIIRDENESLEIYDTRITYIKLCIKKVERDLKNHRFDIVGKLNLIINMSRVYGAIKHLKCRYSKEVEDMVRKCIK